MPPFLSGLNETAALVCLVKTISYLFKQRDRKNYQWSRSRFNIFSLSPGSRAMFLVFSRALL